MKAGKLLKYSPVAILVVVVGIMAIQPGSRGVTFDDGMTVTVDGPVHRAPGGDRSRDELTIDIRESGAGQSIIIDGKPQFSGWHLSRSRVTRSSSRLILNSYDSSKPPIDVVELSEMWEHGKLNASVSSIWLIDMATHEKRRVSDPAIHATRPAISPNGKWAVFTGQPISKSGPGVPSLFVANLESREVHQIPDFKEQADRIMAWRWSGPDELVAFGSSGETAKYKYYWTLEFSSASAVKRHP